MEMKRWKLIAIFSLFFCADSAWSESVFIDPQDGYLDGSRWLLEHSGFLPVPIIITEPAVGYGGGVALVFMSKDKDAPPMERTADGSIKFSPPVITAIAAAFTENGTKFGGVFHKRSWNHDHWRYLGGIGAASVNLDFYGLNGTETTQYLPPLAYNLDGFGLIQDLRYRIAESDWFLGFRYLYADVTSSFGGDLPSFMPDPKERLRNGGLALVANVDTRDNTLTPEKGYQAEFRYYFFDKMFGGERSYELGLMDLTGFWKFNHEWGAAGRFLFKHIQGDAPFYSKPYIDVRGIAKMRYQGDSAASAEVEIRWNPQPRWQYLAFGGAGKAETEIRNFEKPETASAYGIGFRYLLARLLGFKMGIDIARGPEETVWYIQAGTAWN